MKRFVFLLSILFCSVAFAHTIEWYVGDNLLSTTTCESGDNITPPTAPTKYGYHFVRWDGYTPIEYLEFTGTQKLKVSILNASKAYLHAKLGLLISNANNMDIWINNPAIFFAHLSGRLLIWTPELDAIYINTTVQTNTLYNIEYFINPTQTVFIINNLHNYLNISPKLDTETQFVSFNMGNSSKPFYGRIYYYQFFDKEANLVLDLIPVLDKDGTPCMYDKVEGKFYYNAGTGNFIAGPIINE